MVINDMSAQVGIPKYNDLVNQNHLDKLKNDINILCVVYNKLANKDAVERRESDNSEIYTKQYDNDMIYLNDLRNYTSDLLREIDETIYCISKRCISNHINNGIY